MTFGQLLPPVTLYTGLDVYGLRHFLIELDANSAAYVAVHLLALIEALRQLEEVDAEPLVREYWGHLERVCEAKYRPIRLSEVAEDERDAARDCVWTFVETPATHMVSSSGCKTT